MYRIQKSKMHINVAYMNLALAFILTRPEKV